MVGGAGVAMLLAFRAWATLVALAYIGSVGYFLVPLIQGQPDHTAENLLYLLPPFAAALLFVWGLAAWRTRWAWLARLVAWPVLVAGCFVLIGFTFVLLLPLLTTGPALWPGRVWRVMSGESDRDET